MSYCSLVALETDQELAMVALETAVQAHRDGAVMLSYGPKCDSKSKGQAGNANLNVAGMRAKLVQAAEHHHQVQLAQEHALLPRVVGHSG